MTFTSGVFWEGSRRGEAPGGGGAPRLTAGNTANATLWEGAERIELTNVPFGQ